MTKAAMQKHEQELDFQSETDADIACDSNEPKAIEGGEIIWRWATAADMAALRLIHFQSEVESGQALYLPERPSDQRVIAVAERNGQIVGGIMAEDSVAVTMIGTDRDVAESAYDPVIRRIVGLARKEGTRVVEIRLPGGARVDLDTGVQAEEQNSNIQMKWGGWYEW